MSAGAKIAGLFFGAQHGKVPELRAGGAVPDAPSGRLGREGQPLAPQTRLHLAIDRTNRDVGPVPAGLFGYSSCAPVSNPKSAATKYLDWHAMSTET